MVNVTRVGPASLQTTLKEAVADAIVNLTFAHVSGAGSVGKYVFGTRPRAMLSSGFLLPQRQADGDDEVTSPIWISSHGFQFQLAAGVAGIVEVQPRLSVYVRVLPRDADFERPDCKVTIRLKREVQKALQEERNARLNAEWDKLNDKFKSRRECPQWGAIKSKVLEELYAAKDIPTDLAGISPGEESDGPTDSALSPGATVEGDVHAAGMAATEVLQEGGQASAPAGASASAAESLNEPAQGIVVGAKATKKLSDKHFEPIDVPHKWMRLDIQVPPVSLDMSKSVSQQKTDIATHGAAMTDAVNAALAAWRDSPDPEEGGQMWGYRHGCRIPASQYQNWKDALIQIRQSKLHIVIPEIRLDWNLQSSPDWSDTGRLSVLLALENKSERPAMFADESDEAVFQVTLRATVPSALHRPLRLERVSPSYRYNKYLRYAAMGHNCGVIEVSRGNDEVVLETTWAPRYVQPRIVPTDVAGVNRHVRALAAQDGLGGLLGLPAAYDKWLDDVKKQVNPHDGLPTSDVAGRKRETDAFNADLEAWAREHDAIATGLQILAESRQAWTKRGPQADERGAVFEAFVAMNEAMADFMQQRFGNDNGKWRLFQLAFIIANVPALASRLDAFKGYYDEKRDDTATLLYFATGGGKSEAFFGLLLFSLLLDRLRMKRTGVSALMRYPLRLLTIQQAQRCAKVMAYAERVRVRHDYGGDAFSMGFWVGSSGSPNRHNTPGVSNIPFIEEANADLDTETKLRGSDREHFDGEDRKYFNAWRAWHKLANCPFCDAPTALRRFRSEGGTLAHVCTNAKCFSNAGPGESNATGAYRPLPFYICDEDIYDFAPSVLLGTVDKLALIGHSASTIRRIYGMFGLAPCRDMSTGRLVTPLHKELEGGPPAGCEALYPVFKNGKKHFHDPFPSLIVQDEAHLLDESLGAFAGLFESTLDAIFEHLSRALGDVVSRDAAGKRRRAKVIAASATVAEPQRQLEHLYQRVVPAVQFPHPGPTLYESFYAAPEPADEPTRRALEDSELSSKQARIYCAFMTNGKPHTATSVSVLSSFHLVITSLFERLVSGDDQRFCQARELMAASVSAGPLFSDHKAALEAASASLLATAVDLHRVALTYVTNKKGGDQLMAAEAEETRKRHVNADERLAALDTRLITGSVEQGEVKAVVDAAQRRVGAGEQFEALENVLRSVIATSAISHGVDVEELNSMFFAGMPSDIAEYIQASSRVGRTHVGFVVLIPTPQRRRDRLIVELFDIFHRFLERMVQPAAIDRWAERAVERVLPSLLQTYLAGVVPCKRLIEADDDQKHRVPSFTWMPEILAEHRKRQDAFVKEIDAFIELAVGLKPEFAPAGQVHYRQLIDEKVRGFLDEWGTVNWKNDGTLKKFFDSQLQVMRRPMTSLRDVDEGGVIRAAKRLSANRYLDPKDVISVMDLIRNGVAVSEEGEDEE